MKSYIAHYRNKYPGGRVFASEDALDAYDADGNHCVAMRKDGHGRWVCRSEEFGCDHAHDLSPIPRDARIHKLHADGKVGLDEDAADRKTFMASDAAKPLYDGKKVKSIAEIGKKHFDEKGNYEGTAAAAAAPAAANS